MAIKAVVFDADGVTIHPWRFAQYLEAEHNLPPARTAPFFTGPFVECLLGRADLTTVLPPFLHEWNWPESVDSFIERWMVLENAPDERMLAEVARLRAAGWPCYLATNQETHRAIYLRQHMHFDQLFDGLFISCEIGAIKHDSQFYTAVTKELDTDPESILFWDDSASNIREARAAGWQAELFTDYETYRATMRTLLGEATP